MTVYYHPTAKRLGIQRGTGKGLRVIANKTSVSIGGLELVKLLGEAPREFNRVHLPAKFSLEYSEVAS